MGCDPLSSEELNINDLCRDTKNFSIDRGAPARPISENDNAAYEVGIGIP